MLTVYWGSGWEGGPRGGDMCTHIIDSFCCNTETNTV